MSQKTDFEQAMVLLSTYDMRLKAIKELMPLMDKSEKAQILNDLFNHFSIDSFTEISQIFTTGALLMLQGVKAENEKKEDLLEVEFSKDIKALFDTLVNFNRVVQAINAHIEAPKSDPKPYNIE